MKISFGRWVLVLSLIAAERARCGPGDVDLSLNAGSKINAYVKATAVQPDGKILIGGSFTTVPGLIRNFVARMDADGTPDPAFNPGSGPNGTVLAMVLQPDGEILIGGEFTKVNGAINRGIARLNPDGSLDTSFNSNLPGNVPFRGNPPDVESIALQPDGRIFVGGVFSVDDGGGTGVARLMPDGSVDNSFYPRPGAGGVWPYVQSLALQPDGRLIVVGDFTEMNGSPRSGLARLMPDGSLDTTYAPSVIPYYAHRILIQPDGKLLLGGMLAGKTGLFRLLLNGTVDPAFNVPLQGGLAPYEFVVEGIQFQPDGKILMAAYCYEGETSFMQVSRLNGDGSIDPSFYGNVTGVETMSLQPDGDVILGGGLAIIDPSVGNYFTELVRLDATGAWQTNFNALYGIKSPLLDVALQSDGKILVGGFWRLTYENPSQGIARLNRDGSVDMSFTSGLGLYSMVYSMTPQPDGKIVICGDLFLPDSGQTNHAGVARLNTDGTLDHAYRPPIAASAGFASTIQPDEKVLVAGRLSIVDAGITNSVGIVRLNPDGTLDPQFHSAVTNGSVTAVALQSDGRILIGGTFTNVDGVSRYSIARLNSDGSLDMTFGGGPSGGGVSCILPRADGKIFVGGNFGGNIALLNSDGSFDKSFQFTGRLGELVPGPATVYSMAEGLDGKLLIAGNIQLAPYTNANGHAFLQLNPDGSVDASFNSHPGADVYVAGAAKQPDGNFVIVGQFNSVNGAARSGVARLFGEGPIIDTQPTNQITGPGRTATFNVAASGPGTLSYQWFKNGTPLSDNKQISGTMTDTLVLRRARPNDTGSFTATVSNSAGMVISDAVQLQVQTQEKLPPRKPVRPHHGGGDEKTIQSPDKM
jgi:uncharacterized delta-60 repeat protein